MKKIFLFLACICIFSACGSDDETPVDSTSSTEQLIIGEWVYDDPNGGQWEKRKFLSNMKFYYSYLHLRPYVAQENAEGNYYYTESSHKFTFTYQNIFGGIDYQDVVIESINDYSYTASEYADDNSFVGRYTYHKLIDVVDLNLGETNTPKYDRLIPNVNITIFKSNNEEVATVDSSTGEITAGTKVGRTYINVVTDEGIAYVEVNVTDLVNILPDYTSALNMNEEEVRMQWSDYCIYATPVANCIHYPLVGYDYADMAMVWLDDDKNVESVQIAVKTTVKNETERETAIHEYLSTKYEYQSKDNGVYMYFDLPQPQILPMAIYYSPSQDLIEYQKIEFTELWPDYSKHFGQSADELKKLYGTPFMETESGLYFLQENEYVSFVRFALTEDTKKVYASSAYLTDGSDWQEAVNYLNTKYYYYEKGSDAVNNWFAFTNKSSLEESNIGITFDGKNGLITYVDLTLNKSKRATLKSIKSIKTNNRTDSFASRKLTIPLGTK